MEVSLGNIRVIPVLLALLTFGQKVQSAQNDAKKGLELCEAIVAAIQNQAGVKRLEDLITQKWNSKAGLEEIIFAMPQFREAELIESELEPLAAAREEALLRRPKTDLQVEVPWLIRTLYKIYLQRLHGAPTGEAMQSRRPLEQLQDTLGSIVEEVTRGEKNARMRIILDLVKSEVAKWDGVIEAGVQMPAAERERITTLALEFLGEHLKETLPMLYAQTSKFIAAGFFQGPQRDFYSRTSMATAESIARPRFIDQVYIQNIFYVFEKMRVARDSSESDAAKRAHAKRWVEHFFENDIPSVLRRETHESFDSEGLRVLQGLKDFYLGLKD